MMAKPLNSFELFGIGQVLGGIACGSGKVIYQLFAESTPVEFRGIRGILCSAQTSHLNNVLLPPIFSLILKFRNYRFK